MAKAAQKFGIPFTLSTMSICSIEDLVEAGVEPFWFQLYVMRDREFMKDLIRRAKEAKCSALMVTVDLQVLGNRHRDIKNGLSTPPKFTIPNMINLSTKIPWGLRYVFGNRRWRSVTSLVMLRMYLTFLHSLLGQKNSLTQALAGRI